MSNIEGFGSIEKSNIESSIEYKEKMNLFNQKFESKLTPENGIYGVKEIVKDNGTIELLGKNESGHSVKEYFNSSGNILKRREMLGEGRNATTYFDDNGVGYLRKVTQLGDNHSKVISSKLAPEVTITKGNFTAVTDAYGRPVLNKISDLSIKEAPRESLSRIKKDGNYRVNDHRGHIIADNFGGPPSQENVVAQLSEVNLGKMKQVENLVRDYKAEGKTVDYEVKTNYSGSKSGRPTSFEPKITVDGAEIELPPELKKIVTIQNLLNKDNICISI